jgi:hypothetical protein
MSTHPTAAILSACTCGSFRTCDAHTYTGHQPRPIAHLSLRICTPNTQTPPCLINRNQRVHLHCAWRSADALCSTAALHKCYSPAILIETGLRTVDSAPSRRLRSRGRSLL